MADRYVNTDQMIEFLREVRKNQRISPEMDVALLNLQQLLEIQRWNPCIFDGFMIGGCETCEWENRPQKCSCCRRNRHIKDCYEEERKYE